MRDRRTDRRSPLPKMPVERDLCASGLARGVRQGAAPALGLGSTGRQTGAGQIRWGSTPDGYGFPVLPAPDRLHNVQVQYRLFRKTGQFLGIGVGQIGTHFFAVGNERAQRFNPACAVGPDLGEVGGQGSLLADKGFLPRRVFFLVHRAFEIHIQQPIQARLDVVTRAACCAANPSERCASSACHWSTWARIQSATSPGKVR